VRIKFAMLPASDQARAKHLYMQNLGCELAVDKPYHEDGWRWIELTCVPYSTR
jgi:hypothetical protein